jgi:hypothetical protein
VAEHRVERDEVEAPGRRRREPRRGVGVEDDDPPGRGIAEPSQSLGDESGEHRRGLEPDDATVRSRRLRRNERVGPEAERRVEDRLAGPDLGGRQEPVRRGRVAAPQPLHAQGAHARRPCREDPVDPQRGAC